MVIGSGEMDKTKDYHKILIDLLSNEIPFNAIVLAKRFNKEQGFEIVPLHLIKQWKKEALQPQVTIEKLEQRQKVYERITS